MGSFFFFREKEKKNVKWERGANWRGRIIERKEEKREEKKENREGREREEMKGFCIFMRLSSSALTKVLSWSD